MTRILRTAAVLALIAGGLAACDSGSSNTAVDVTPPAPPPVSAPVEDSLGVAFGVAFRANPNTDPRDPGEADIIPVSFTTEPVAIP